MKRSEINSIMVKSVWWCNNPSYKKSKETFIFSDNCEYKLDQIKSVTLLDDVTVEVIMQSNIYDCDDKVIIHMDEDYADVEHLGGDR